jgi:hypothetical protein
VSSSSPTQYQRSPVAPALPAFFRISSYRTFESGLSAKRVTPGLSLQNNIAFTTAYDDP